MKRVGTAIVAALAIASAAAVPADAATMHCGDTRYKEAMRSKHAFKPVTVCFNLSQNLAWNWFYVRNGCHIFEQTIYRLPNNKLGPITIAYRYRYGPVMVWNRCTRRYEKSIKL
jgi:hypothetical protein